ncbi:peptidase U62 [bacterium]|nr:peptidase U62 [bacterium]
MIKEIFKDKIEEFSVKIVNTRIESIREKEIQKIGARVYKNNKIGVAGTLGNEKLENLIVNAEKALKYNIPYAYEVSKDLRMEIKYETNNMSNEKLLNEMETILEYLRKNQPKFIFSGNGKLIKGITSLKNNKKLNLKYLDNLISMSFLIKDKNSANLFDGWTGYAGRAYNRKKVISLIDDFCNTFQNKVEIKKGKHYPIIFVGASQIIFQKLMFDLSGRSYGTGSSLLSGKMGQRIFSEDFTLFHSLDPKVHFTPFFDMEGIVNKNYRYKLIDKGVFKTPYTDKKTASLFNLPLTGSAIGAYDGVPQIGNINFEVKPSKKTLKELIGGNKAIFVIMASGGDFTPEGNFSYPLQLAFLYENGQLIGRLPELNISSNIFDMFGKAYMGTSKDKFFDLSPERSNVIEMKVD